MAPLKEEWLAGNSDDDTDFHNEKVMAPLKVLRQLCLHAHHLISITKKLWPH